MLSLQEVVRSYEESVAPGGSMRLGLQPCPGPVRARARQLLEMGQLALLLEGTLFVHGQAVSLPFLFHSLPFSSLFLPSLPFSCLVSLCARYFLHASCGRSDLQIIGNQFPHDQVIGTS